MKKRALVYLLSSVAAIACLASCGGGSSDSRTTIMIKQHAGTGTKEQPAWIEECASRFMEANKDVSFGNGKKGVNIKFKAEKLDASFYDTMPSDGFNIIIDETRFDAYRYKNNFMDISEVVNLYKDKIEPKALLRCKADQSSETYYGLPFYEYFPGISYDVDLFNDNNYYFADPTETNIYTHTYSLNKELKGNFIKTSTGIKSVGPDGVRGTTDDGMPSSIDEYIILCDRLNGDSNSPIILCTSGTQYSWYLVTALWASLSGVDTMNSVYCSYKDGGTPINVVTGFSDEDLFYSGSGIKKPIVKQEKITDSNGYLVFETEERYYALALFQLLYKTPAVQGDRWLNTKDGSTAKDAQDLFVKGMSSGSKNYSYGMLYDSSYWYHEDKSTIAQWNKDNESKLGHKRNLAYMPMPTQISGSVTEGNGKKNTLMDVGSTYIFVNKNTAKETDKSKACIEFLKYLYSDEQLNSFSATTGLTVPKEYGYKTSELENFYKQLGELRNECNVIPYSSTSTRFVKNIASFNLGFGSNLYNVDGNQEGYLKNLQSGMTSQQIFKGTTLGKEAWDGMQK